MKTFLKIILLVLFIVVAVGAVLIFVKTQLAPPRNIPFHDQYSAPLNASVDSVGQKPFPLCKEAYAKAYHKVKFMNQEGLLSADQADELITKIDTAYGNRIAEYAYKIFNSSVWPEENLKTVLSAIAELRKDRLSNGDMAITHRLKDTFEQIDEIIDNYQTAWEFARSTGFRGLSDAQARLARISHYRELPYLSNNTALMTALKNMPQALSDSHYNSLVAMVNRLAGYRNMTLDSFTTLARQTLNSINEYAETGLYGKYGATKKNVQSLRTRAGDYYDAAIIYYRTKH